jgi:hypothetical protein
MRIPHVIINIHAANNAGSSKSLPRYCAPLLKRQWAGKLRDDSGIEVVEYTDYNPSDTARYHEIESVEDEERVVRAMFPGAFAAVYPDGLRAEIEKVLVEDAEKVRRAKAAAAVVISAHPSFITAGCKEPQAIALQKAGFATLADVPQDLMVVAEIPGIDTVLAMDLVAAGVAERNKAAAASAKK